MISRVGVLERIYNFRNLLRDEEDKSRVIMWKGIIKGLLMALGDVSEEQARREYDLILAVKPLAVEFIEGQNNGQ